MSKEFKLSVNTIDKVKKFVNINMKYDADITVESGRYIIDGKSIMGMFSLDLSKVLKVVIDTEDASVIDSITKEYEEAKLSV